MIYGSMILESNFDKLVNPIETFQEYYENEISLLNNSIATLNEANDVALYNDTSKTKGEFIKNIITKLKKILDKFIDWCKKIVSSIKNFVIKDSDTIKKGLEKSIKDINDAQSFNDLLKCGKKVGLVTRDITDGSPAVFVFDIKGYIEDLNKLFKDDLDKITELNKIIVSNIGELEKNNTLSESALDGLKDKTASMREIAKNIAEKNINKKDYFEGSKLIIVNEKLGVEYVRRTLISAAKDAISAIDYIDKEIKNATDNIKTLENKSSEILKHISMLKEDINREAINVISSAINTTTTVGKEMCQVRIKKLNSAKNIYRVGGKTSTIASQLIK